MAELPKRDWKKIVEESNGTSIFVPEAMVEELKSWDKSRQELSVLVEQAAQLELETRLKLENLIYGARKYFALNGVKKIWSANVGVDVNALKDGVYVFNVAKQEQ